MTRTIFDIGAHEGQDSISLAQESADNVVYAFEPVPALAEIIKNRTVNLPNYNLVVKAVSDYSGATVLNVMNDGTGGQSSLLKFTENVDKVWPAGVLKFTNEIAVEVIRLDEFIEDKNITIIDHLHIDAQGNDLAVLRGMGEYLNIVVEGVVEASNSGRECYDGQNSTEQTVQFLKDNGFDITQISPNDDRGNEVNIFFTRNSTT
jgi:FkbM family methyltransferase